MGTTDEQLDRVRAAAESFRLGIEAADFGGRSGNLKDFPSRCCHHAAKLLGLDEHGVADLARNAVRASFLDAGAQSRLVAEIDAYTAQAR